MSDRLITIETKDEVLNEFVLTEEGAEILINMLHEKGEKFGVIAGAEWQE
jgi:hypothetical protein